MNETEGAPSYYCCSTMKGVVLSKEWGIDYRDYGSDGGAYAVYVKHQYPNHDPIGFCPWCGKNIKN